MQPRRPQHEAAFTLKLSQVKEADKDSKPVLAAEKFGLDDALKKAAAYCQRLESAILDFVCREEIEEWVDPLLDVGGAPSAIVGWNQVGADRPPVMSRRTVRKRERSFVYDYQCVRSAGLVRETRTLLEENGQERNEPRAKLQTSTFVYGNVLQGPVGIFAERFQKLYDYRVVDEDKVGDRPVVIIEAVPKPGTPELTNLYGRAWLDVDTADILKVEWSEQRVGRRDIFEKRGQAFRRTPRITICSEFRAEKNGIRFPSLFVIEEAYLNERGRAFVRSETRVVYKDFKFFTVEVEVR
ncbi:MAG: hypothetical protein OEW05_07470 [Candidatus Aminicenantes bacterium]|nr:hypothetical protein [Candidatus Aminicenantes bacterium]